MAGVLQHLRSSTLNKRPNPASMVDGQVAINYASGSPGMFFKDSNGSLVKVGPVHVGSTAPNVSPASGGTAGNSLGEQWLDTSGGTYVFKIWDGGSWRSEAGEFVNSTGDTMTGSLTMGPSASLIFEGSTDDGFETTLTVVNPTVDRTITLPNVTGTVITTGDTGTVTSTMLLDGTILNADVNASAAIAGTKISPDFGSQTITTTGIVSAALGAAAAPSITFTGDTNTGIYSPGAGQLAISTGGFGRLFVDSSGRLLVGTSSASTAATAVFQGNSGGSTSHAIINLARGVTNPGINLSLGFAQFQDSAGSVGAQIYAQTDAAWSAGSYAGRLVFSTTEDGASSPTERMRIQSNGRVGIGTISPGALLDLAGNNTGLTSPLNATNRLRFTDTDTTQTNDQPTGTIEWYTSDTDSPGVHAYISTDMFNSGSGALVVGTGSGGSVSERVRISSAGTTTLTSAASTAPFIANISASEVARIDSSGRLLVGTSSSSAEAKFVVQGGSTGFGGAVNIQRNATTASAGSTIGFVDFTNSSNNVGARILAEGDGTWSAGTSHPTRLVFSTTADGASSPTERMRITNGGRILLTTTVESSLEAVDVNVGQRLSLCINATDSANRRNWRLQTETDALGDLCFRCSTTNTGGPTTTRVQFTSAGQAYNTTGTWGTLSDVNLKQEIEDASSQWDDIKAVRFRKYRLKDEVINNENASHHLGVIAQELEQTSPGLVVDSEDGVKSVKQSILLMKAAKALQEAMERIEVLEQRLNDAGIN
jgi:hypothetical protein